MTREEAIAMAESHWWEDKTPEEIVAFQLFETRLCMDLGDLQMAVEKSLGRSVWTHEFAYLENLREEFIGIRPKATPAEIMALLEPYKDKIIAIDPRRLEM